MARTVDYSKKAEKIKEQVDELVQELMAAKSAPVVSKRSLKVFLSVFKVIVNPHYSQQFHCHNLFISIITNPIIIPIKAFLF